MNVKVRHVGELECALLKMRCVVGEGERTFDTTKTVVLPRPARRIKDIRATVTEVECDVGEDEVVITGTVHKQIFFIARSNNQVCHVAEDVSFGTVIDIPGAREGMECQVIPRVVRVIPELDETGCSLEQTVVLRVFAKVWEFCQLDVVLDERGPLIKTNEVVAEAVSPVTVEHEEEIRAQKIRQTEVALEDVTCEVERGRVRVRGTLRKEICFVDELDREICEEFIVPLDEVISLPGVEAGMHCQVHVNVGQPETTLIFPPGSMISDRALDRIPLEIFVKVTGLVQVHVKEDREGPLVKVEMVVAENEKQLLLEDVVCIPEGAKKIFDIHAVIQDVECEIIPDKVIIQGNLHKQIFFVGEDDCVMHRRADIPFGTFVDVPGAEPGMICQPNVRVEHIKPMLVRETPECHAPRCHEPYGPEADLFFALRQKVVLQFFVKVGEEAQIRVRLCPERDRGH